MSQQSFADLEAQAKTNKAAQHGMPLEFVLEHTLPCRNVIEHTLPCGSISKWMGI